MKQQTIVHYNQKANKIKPGVEQKFIKLDIQSFYQAITKGKENGLKDWEIAEYYGIAEGTVRWRRKQYMDDKAFQDITEANDLQQWEADYAWIKEDGKSVRYKKNGQNQKELYDKLITDIEVAVRRNTSPVEEIKYSIKPQPHCLIIDPTDVHFGKLATQVETGDSYNLKVTEYRFKKGVDELLKRGLNFNIDKIIFVIGNDILHIDNKKRTTTQGTPQDTDGMYHEAFVLALHTYIDTISTLTTVAPVHIVHCMSNHDELMGWALAQAVRAAFTNNKNVTMDVTPSFYKYVEYGGNMFMFSHGDGAKEEKLPLIAYEQSPDIFTRTKKKYAFLHHVHHKIAKDVIGMHIEYSRSISSSDPWHAKNGYFASPAMDAYAISHDTSSYARLTEFLK